MNWYCKNLINKILTKLWPVLLTLAISYFSESSKFQQIYQYFPCAIYGNSFHQTQEFIVYISQLPYQNNLIVHYLKTRLLLSYYISTTIIYCCKYTMTSKEVI